MRIIFFFFAFALSLSANAGSRNGYRLVFFDDSPIRSPEAIKIFKDYFNAELPPNTYRCEAKNRFIDIDLAYVNRLPKAVTPELIRNGVGSNPKALEKLRLALREFRDTEIDRGFDGLIVFRNDGKVFELTTISSISNGYMKSARLSDGHPRLTPANLKNLFCQSTAELDFAYQGD